MENNMKSAFDSIQAEVSLKESTLLYLHGKMQRRTVPLSGKIKRSALLTACLLLLCSGAVSYHLYFTKSAYIDVDINPSLELTVNRFNRIIDTEAYNSDGEVLLDTLALSNEPLEQALDEIIEAASLSGVLQKEGLVSVTVQTPSENEKELLADVESEVTASVSNHSTAKVHVFCVDSSTKTTSHDLHISPAKYLAILNLQAVDSTATVAECQNHSISEIQERTQTHTHNHTLEHHGEH